MLKVTGDLAYSSSQSRQSGWELCGEPGTVKPPAMAQMDELIVACRYG